MSKRRYITPLELDLKKDLEAAQKASEGVKEKSSESTGLKLRLYGNIIRVLNSAAPSQRVAIDATLIEQMQKNQKKGKSILFFAYCPEHGYGRYRIVKEVASKASGKHLYLIECTACLEEKTKKNQKKETKRKPNIFERVFGIFRERK